MIGDGELMLPLLVFQILKDFVESISEVSLHRFSNAPSQRQHLFSFLQLHSFTVQFLRERKFIIILLFLWWFFCCCCDFCGRLVVCCGLFLVVVFVCVFDCFGYSFYYVDVFAVVVVVLLLQKFQIFSPLYERFTKIYTSPIKHGYVRTCKNGNWLHQSSKILLKKTLASTAFLSLMAQF